MNDKTTRDERIMDDGEIYPNKKSVTISAKPFIEKGYSNIIKSEIEGKSKNFQEVAADLYDEMQNEHLQNLIAIKNAIANAVTRVDKSELKFSKHGKPKITLKIQIWQIYRLSHDELEGYYADSEQFATYLHNEFTHVKKLCRADGIHIKYAFRSTYTIYDGVVVYTNDYLNITVCPKKEEESSDNNVKGILSKELITYDDDDIISQIAGRICVYCLKNPYENMSNFEGINNLHFSISCDNLCDGCVYQYTTSYASNKAKKILTDPDAFFKFSYMYRKKIFRLCAGEGIYVYWNSEYYISIEVYTKPIWYSYITHPWLRKMRKEINKK